MTTFSVAESDSKSIREKYDLTTEHRLTNYLMNISPTLVNSLLL